ncbi:MAG TPA: diguanylate cyclase [Gemmatimonadaceae bacterium]|nr:diguanylate cyclase [Gemmatimonadaceae bacterium]
MSSEARSTAARRPDTLRLVRDESPTALALVEEAQLAERQGRHEDARQIYHRALYALGPGAPPDTASALLRWIGRTYQVEGNLEAALDCLGAALAVAEALGDDVAAGHAINLQAICHWHQGRLDEAEALYLRARERALRVGERKLAAMIAQNLGVVAKIRGDLTKALHYYQSSLGEYRALGLARDAVGALNNLGMCFTDLQRWDAAEQVYDEALAISTSLGDVSARILLEVNRAAMWVARGELDDAERACDEAMALARTTQGTPALGDAIKIAGIIARERGDHAAAEERFAAAEQLADERQDALLAAETAREKAELFRRTGRNRDTLQALNRAHRLFSQLRARRELADLDRKVAGLETEFLEVVRRWGESIESKDRYTLGHCERVADLACALAARVGFDRQSLFWFRIGALLHDVGKLIIPAEVLNKPGRLTPAEWTLVRAHPSAGVEMLKDIDFPWDVVPMVQSHHERWDGAGYPDGLAGEAIPLAARILCIADVYDSLTSERSYKPALPHGEAMRIMRAEAGREFDPHLFGHFEEVMRVTRQERPATRRVPTPRASTAVGEPAAPPPTDDLTGLLTRRGFLEQAMRECFACSTAGHPVALLVIDVDHFKQVNDTYGHMLGDEVLIAAGDVLRRHTRQGDVLGRYAGDEFVVLLPGAGRPEAVAAAEELRAAIRSRACALRGARDGAIRVTFSIGVATAPEHGDTVEALFAAADQALLAAKRKGRNTVTYAARDGADDAAPAPDIERFVGRASELGQLVHLLDESVRSGARCVALVGEAGVGKTTLLRQLAPEVRLRAGSLVTGRCLEADVRPPYAPWAEAVEAIRALGIVPDREWRELPRLVPALGEAPTAGQPAASRFALLDEITQYLRLAAASRPLLVVLDDMQWADSATWATLEHVLGHLEHDRVLVCLTLRAEEAGGAVGERRRRFTRTTSYRELTLDRLTREELAAWVQATFHDVPLTRELAPFLYAHTEGNPLLVVQTLRTLLEDGVVWHDGQRWAWRPVTAPRLPVAVTDLVARRLERLSPTARGVLTTAAVIGRVFDVGLAVAAGAGSEDAVLDAIDEGLEAAVLVRVADRDDRVAFAHVLLVEAIRRAMPARRARRVHERVAEALVEHAPGAVSEIAAHFDQAGRHEEAYRYAMKAGARAGAVFAHDEATAFFAMAERHAAGAAERAAAQLERARVAETAGRYAEAEELAGLVRVWLASDGAPPSRSLPVRRMVQRLRALQGQPPHRSREACRLLLAEAEAAGIERERVALLTMISRAESQLGEWQRAEELARECVRLAGAIGDVHLLADALVRHGTTLLEHRPTAAADLFRQALTLYGEVEDRFGQTRCHINLGIAYARAGHATAAEDAYEVALELGRGAHLPDLAGLASLNLGALYVKEGRYEQADERLAEAERLFSTTRNEPHRLAALYNMAHLARERGDLGGARERYAEVAAIAHVAGRRDIEIGARAGAGFAALALGDRAMAAEALGGATGLLGDRTDWWFQGRELLAGLAVRSALEAGDPATARALLETAFGLALRHDPFGAVWLVVECAPLLTAQGDDVRPLLDRCAPLAVAEGGRVATRFAALMGAASPGGHVAA